MTNLIHTGAGPRAIQAPVDLGASQQTFRQRATAVILRKYTSPETRRAYMRDLEVWLEFCADRSQNPWLTEPLAAAAFRELREAAAAPGSVYRCMAALSAIYIGLRQEIPNLTNPFDGRFTARPNATARKKRPPVPQEYMVRMLAACDGDENTWEGVRDAALLSFMWATGVRRAGVCSANADTWTDTRGPAGEAEGVVRVVVKGGSAHDVRVPEDTAARVRKWLEVRGTAPGAMFTRPGGARMKGHDVYAVVKRRAKAAGVDPAKVMPHGFRSGLVTRAFAEKLPDHQIQASVHHARIQTTREYDHGERGAAVSRAVGRLPTEESVQPKKGRR